VKLNFQPSEDIFNSNQALFGQLLRQKVAINSQKWSPYLGSFQTLGGAGCDKVEVEAVSSLTFDNCLTGDFF